MVDSRDRSGHLGRTQEGITKAAIINPKLSLSLPGKYTATTILDTLMSAVEGYLSTRSSYISNTLFAKAIELVASRISYAVENPEDIRSRADASMAGLLSAVGLSMSKQGLGAAIAYAINARHRVPKSWAAAILLPHVMEYSTSAAAERIAEIAELLGEDVGELSAIDAAGRAVEAVRRMIAFFKLPTRLREFGVEMDDLMECATTARSFDMINCVPRAVSTDDLYEIIKTAF